MLCYKDKTFCENEDCRHFGPCPRSLTDDVLCEAVDWWGGDDAPVAVFVGRPDCFEPKEGLHGT